MSPRDSVIAKLSGFWSLTKARQTMLLLATGICGYLLSKPASPSWHELGRGIAALYLAISGCTALNMIFDRDIDAKMVRTAARPLPQGRLNVIEAGVFGCGLSCAGLWLAWSLGTAFGIVVTLGFLIDLCVYTLWLKRLTPFSILWGGVSGGMPAMAGRVLATDTIDTIGILLALAIILWIPSHILTLIMAHAADYAAAGVPVWPNRFGMHATRRLIAATTLLDALVFIACATLLNITTPAYWGVVVSSIGITAIALWCWTQPHPRHDFMLFKAASVYMLLSFMLLAGGSIL
ncbi:MAG: protoheme IX farnesyltransferase [Desulfobacterota bacterium]|nr:protoheme IX farnesyltransferase [Thermodesulfobacteriota bacterium]